MKVFMIIFGIINGFLMLFTGYVTVFAMTGLFRKVISFPETDGQRHFAVLLAARNEEAVIGTLIDSIKNCDYPQDKIDIYVIVNNCTDRTEEIARGHGANIIECTVPTKTKGDVLRFALGELDDHDEIDAYAVFDADNIINPEFFVEMNKALASGAAVVQGYRSGKNLGASWVADCYEIYYTMQNAYYNHPRTAAGLSAAISGTGWVMDKGIVQRRGFLPETITEDYEMTIMCALEGEKITYCNTAITYDEYTPDLKTSMRQRLRWTFGIVQAMRLYEKRLVRRATKGSFMSFDMAIINILPFAMGLSMFAGLIGYIPIASYISFPVYLVSMCAAAWISMSLSALLSVIKTGDGVRKNLRGVCMMPAFIATWLPILVTCLVRKDVTWTPIKHGA